MVLRAIAVWLYSIMLFSLTLVGDVILLGAISRRWLHLSIRAWGWGSLKILGIKLEFEGDVPDWARGSSAPPARSARVLVVNHQSTLDLLWGAAICPPGPVVIGKREIVYVPVIGLVFLWFGFILVDRKNSTRAVAAVAGAASKIRRREMSLIVAPEGTRSATGEILPFKKGAFHIAVAAQVPICPFVVAGAYELMSKDEWLPRPGTIRLRFLPEVPTVGLQPGSGPDLDALVDRVRASIVVAYEGMRLQSKSKSHLASGVKKVS